ncbi:HAD-like domain-containing protein [Neohortaea acidophila]|uniref:HAD-like domain-containing protein n=1 Tax=Neohortaea acidophila TaxID=245834 RepID=A0A6A6PFE5_9PEZI|nr:HAD-like domain-containing protein [Neohortaea acidophila]KAF2478708.1 HAD-like domain-containing protein [Neohortaea acidophila]
MAAVKCVLLDIEGTVCPISFVKDTLFPYALKALPDVLSSKWDDEDFRPYRDAFPEEARQSAQELQAHVEDLTKRDVKIAYLKNLQGYLWETGYKTGAYSTPLFPDVAPQLRKWKEQGVQLVIYSSGSVFAQKLLFGHVASPTAEAGQKRKRALEGDLDHDETVPAKKKAIEGEGGAADGSDGAVQMSSDLATNNIDTIQADTTNLPHEDGNASTEDLQHLISGWFDTTNAGLKQDAGSYKKIADALQMAPQDIHFLSDNVKEVEAAIEAGMASSIVDRPGNAPLSEEDKARFHVVQSLDQVSLTAKKASNREEVDAVPEPEKPSRRRSQRLKGKDL